MSVVYDVRCKCGKELDVRDVWLDGGDDLCIEVGPCPDCIKEAEKRVREEIEESL